MKEKINAWFFPKDTVRSLDGLRGNAILILLLTHSANWNNFFFEGLNFHFAGRIGACLFFILSSFLLSRQMLLMLSGGKPLEQGFKKYYLRRVFRIYPLYLIGLIALGILTHYNGKVGAYAYPLREIPGHLLALKGNGIFWTLNVELKYYLGLPFLMLLCFKVTRFDLFKTFLLLVGLYLVAFALWAAMDFRRFPFMEVLPTFMVGTLLAVYHHTNSWKAIKPIRSVWYDVLGAVVLVALLLMVPYYHKLFFGREINIKHPAYNPFIAVFWATVVFAALYGSGLVRRIFEIKPLRFLGTIGYSVYILHMPVLFFVNSEWLNLAPHLRIYVFFGLTLVVSTLGYLAIERPMALLKIKHT